MDNYRKTSTLLHYPQQDLELNYSYASTAKSVPKETCNEKKKKKSKLLEVQPSEEGKPTVVENPEVQKKQEKHEPNKEVGTMKT